MFHSVDERHFVKDKYKSTLESKFSLRSNKPLEKNNSFELKKEKKYELLKSIRSESFDYYKLKRQAFSQKKQKDLIISILEDEKKFKFYCDLLLNLNKLRNESSYNQAYIRILAHSLIEEKAKKYDIGFLEEFTKRLIMNKSENIGVKGAKEDILDLMLSWVYIMGRDKVLDDPSLLFEAFSYKKENRELFSYVLSYLDPCLFWKKNKSDKILRILDKGLY